MNRDGVIEYLAAMTDDEFHQTAAQARTLSAARTVDDRLAAAQERGDINATIALKREKFQHQQAKSTTTEGPTQ
jgi:hypothetical protein